MLNSISATYNRNKQSAGTHWLTIYKDIPSLPIPHGQIVILN